jgi:hypothetical protein
MSWSVRIGAASAALLVGCGSVLDYDQVRFESDAGPSAHGGSAGSGGTGGGGATDGSGGATGGSGGATGGSGGATGGSGGATGGSSGAGATGGSGGTTDPYEQARQTCVDHINSLRATKGLAPYQRWASAEECADLQATDDEQTGTPHGAWSSRKFACDGYGSAQNECLGGGPSGIVSCLNMMWAEKDQPGCAGCDTCTTPGGCADCDFYGSQTGDVCGHYVNMSSKSYSMVVCGFSSLGGWSVQNFR